MAYAMLWNYPKGHRILITCFRPSAGPDSFDLDVSSTSNVKGIKPLRYDFLTLLTRREKREKRQVKKGGCLILNDIIRLLFSRGGRDEDGSALPENLSCFRLALKGNIFQAVMKLNFHRGILLNTLKMAKSRYKKIYPGS